LPQFKTEIDGVDLHLIPVRSRHKGVLPLIITHGWPGSIVSCLRPLGRQAPAGLIGRHMNLLVVPAPGPARPGLDAVVSRMYS